MESELPLGGSSSTGHLSSAGVAFASGGTGRMHHSLSTPAGVDCGGGSQGLFRTPPATPKKGGKMLAVRVQMLDDSITMFQVQAKALGRVLFDQVCRQLHLLEADYFGLEYQELGGTKYWLDLEKPVCRQVGLSLIDPLLRFCVKFYTPGPAQLEEEFTRYLFCLQVKRDLAHGCIQCNENTSALMASYIVQAECGDFVPEDYPDHTYLSSYKFFPLQDADLERRIMENHKKHMGQSPAEADLNLLETARRCELYGMKMHPAKDHEGVPLNIAVAHLGIVVFQHLTKINTFSWAKIRKISFKRKRFLIKLHPEGYGYYKDLVEFFFEGRNECKNFWKKCVENHGFFRCSSVKRMPRHRTRVLSRGSSFRYSGRTQKQIVEFVRDNYVKRQTFQRSQSFRVSRSLRSSRANVSSGSANLVSNNPNSVSAHPLLPLPPGSNAISLEWDKQPQYLEASLMMKGYTGEGEAARQAMALVERQRRRSEGATNLQTRQPDTLTSSAATRDQGTGLVTHVEVNHHRMEDSPPPRQMTTPLGSPESTWSRSTSPHSSIITTSTTHAPPRQAQPPVQPPPRSRLPDATTTPSDGAHDKDETDKMDTSAEGFFLLPQSPASKQERSFFASTPKAENGPPKQMIPPPSPTIRAPGEGPDDAAIKVNGIDKQTGVSRGQLNSDSSYSIDVLSGGESECESLRKRRPGKDDTLGRLMKSPLTGNGVINTEYTQAGTETFDAKHGKRHHADKAFYIAKELLMTERTYKKDLEVITVWLRRELSSETEEDICGGPLWAPLEALAVSQAGVLRILEARLASRPSGTLDNNNSDAGIPMQSLEANRTGTLMLAFLEESLPWYEKWICEHLGSLQRLEEACHNTPSLERLCRDLEHYQRACYLPLSTFALKPLYRLLHYRRLLKRASELYTNDEEELEAIKECVSRLRPVCDAVESALPDSLNYAHLCLLHRDIDGFDNLVLPERQFIRQGCLFKHSNKGPQQRMFFLFSDILVYGSKGSSSQQQFRVHGVIPLSTIQVEQAEYNNSFTLYGGGRAMTLSASTSSEKDFWMNEIEHAADEAKNGSIDSTPMARSNSTSGSAEELAENMEGVGAALQRSNTLAHVCWHRNSSLSWRHLETAMENQLSGYLLRKFKNSLGWQKLWVVFASFCLYFYKSSNDDFPLASLPLLGYLVTTPNERDGINKDFVFKLVFKNHVYFFRAESDYTFKRWMEVINSATNPPNLDDQDE